MYKDNDQDVKTYLYCLKFVINNYKIKRCFLSNLKKNLSNLTTHNISNIKIMIEITNHIIIEVCCFKIKKCFFIAFEGEFVNFDNI